ncbi:flagellar hook assembly protein FlgD [Paracoccus ravus]|uniref:flagellar hook assembly protein FlgD n=1 Tax=Paracoccus ravus TaxID=2447760 RepID=UPI00106E94D3|nr:flagellar hook capping FlgD N-terminal domain-containing protein [Paracoccus ravus]
MAVSSISAITQSSSSSQADTALSQLSEDYTRFIKLLVAQVQYQDPLEPMDSTQFVSQIAQLTQVEQAVQTNKHIENLSAALAATSALEESQLIGREVTTFSETIVLDETGADFAYELENTPTAVSAIISDGDGNIIHQIDGLSTQSGRVIDVHWDGLDADGNPVPAGEYTVTLATPGGSGAYSTYTSSVVEYVQYDASGTTLILADGRNISSGNIMRVN